MKTFKRAIFCLICFAGIIDNSQADIPTTGLVAYWEAENNADDSFGAFDGTSNGATYVAGEYGQAFHFAGTNQNQVISIDHDDALQPASITVAAWIRTGQTSGLQMIADKSHGSVDQTGWALQLLNGKIAWASGNGSSFPQLNGSITVADNAFHHIAVTLDDSTNLMSLYVDGNPDGTLAYNSPQTGNNRPVNIGAWYEGTLDSQYGREFAGDIDDVAIYNRALSQSEIGQLRLHSVPEPGAFAGLLAGMIGYALRRRRRSNVRIER